MPEGLVLLTSVALAAGVLKPSSMGTLTQELPAIETLARVDTICLDKTGTITEGKMSVEKRSFTTVKISQRLMTSSLLLSVV